MISKIVVSNFTLIDYIDIDFQEKFSVITGETGAGKSLLLNAINFCFGKRSSIELIKNIDKKAVVEITFDISKLNLNNFFEQNDIDYHNNTIIRREILPNGKSRAFINDTPVNTNTLKNLSEKLIDIHSQHQNLILSDNDFQIDFVDLYADNQLELENYRILYKKYTELISKERKLISDNNEVSQNIEIIKKEIDILSKLEIETIDYLELEKKINFYQNFENTITNLRFAHDILDDSKGVIEMINILYTKIQNIAEESIKYSQFFETIKSIKLDINELRNDIDIEIEKIDLDPSQIQLLKDKFNSINSFMVKYNISNINELIELLNHKQTILDNYNNYQSLIEIIENDKKRIFADLSQKANLITNARHSASKKLTIKLEEMLKSLSIENGKIIIELINLEKHNAKGIDEVTIKFSANIGIKPEEIGKIASGGEISRLMLCIKNILSQKLNLATIIFDEIDTGVSGKVANQMAKMMIELSKNTQVISISHLPQIASKATNHYFVYKESVDNNTYTNIKLLQENERISEIAKMLSGDSTNQFAVENAKSLLNEK